MFATLSSCRQKTTVETQQSIEDPIQNSVLVTQTQLPTSTSLPLTITPTLSPDEPLLIYLDKSDQKTFWALSSSHLSKTSFKLPENSCIRDWQNSISPHGHWMVIYINCFNNEVSSETSLALFHIPDGRIRLVTQLFMDEKSADLGNDIFTFDWSTDGLYLVFAGAIDKPYFDLYLYDLEQDVVRRLTDDLQSIEYVEFSPDSKWIWFENSEPEGAYSTTYFYALQTEKLDIQSPKAILDSRWNINEGWVSLNEYFLVNASEGCCGENNLRYINVESKQEIVLWKSFTTGYAIDPENQSIVVSAAPESDLQGLYLVDWDGKRKKISDGMWLLVFRGGTNSRYVGFDGEKVVTISQDGTLSQISEKPFYSLSVSPDKTWYVLYDKYKKIPSIDLYSGNDLFIKTISNEKSFPAAWLPDSSGFFYIAQNLYFVSIPDGEPVMIEECEKDECEYWIGESDFIWSYP